MSPADCAAAMLAEGDDAWLLRRFGDEWHFVRLDSNGQVSETYVRVPSEKAAVWAVAVISGFQPPRALRDLDTPFGRTRPAPPSASVASADRSPGH
jgi:hypothetical protein